MRRVHFGWLALVLLFGRLFPNAQAATQNRIVGGAGTVTIPGSVIPSAAQAADLGEADGDTALLTMSLRFNKTAVQEATLTQLLIDQQNPVSAKYHQWLSPEQFAGQFGLSTTDVAKISQWLTAQGFKIESVARSRTFIGFSGTVAQAEAAFQTSIHQVSLDGEEHIANVTPIVLPSAIAGVVGSVMGLNDFRMKPRARAHLVPAGVDPKFTSSISGKTFLAPADFATIYDTNPLLKGSTDGTGITIAIAGQTDISLADVAAFRSAAGLIANPPTVMLFGTDPGTTPTDVQEAQLDVEWSGAVAPSASILYANSTDVLTSLTMIIDNKLAPIASISYGQCETGVGQSVIDTLNASLMQANAQGMTVVGPSGDSGATDCDHDATIATQGLAVDFPASSPYLTGVGGTMFSEGTGTYWATTNGAAGESALSYIPESVWNLGTTAGELSAGGGGVSVFFTKPAWQTGAGVPNDFARDVPDVALNADQDHDGYLICSQGSCVTGFRTSSTPTATCPTGGCLLVVGGTSASTPSFAGILALVEQKIGATSGIGNANPVIYALANSTYYNTVFHDVQTGNNESLCQAGSTDCPSGGSIGFTANVGYDLASGWGSVDAFNLANDWTLVTGAGGTTGLATATSLVASAPSVTSGTSVSITATVADASKAPVPSIGPTGTVQFLVDNVASGGAVTLTAAPQISSTATFTLDTTALSPGSHTVSAAYSGDMTYAGSKGSVPVAVVSATAPDLVLSPATTTVTVAAGADAPAIVYTITPLNGFTGPVNFTATTTSPTLNATYSFTVTPLAVTAPTVGTTTLNLSAYVAQGASGTALVRHTYGTAVLHRPVQPGAKHGTSWYAESGAAFACIVLLILPRRRQMKASLGVMLAVCALGGILGLQGCGSSSNNVNLTQVNATPGMYTVVVSATGMSAGVMVTHNATVTLVVR